MPVGDPQFWLVSAVALVAALRLLRGVIPRSHEDDTPACGGCATGAAACSKPEPGDNASGLVRIGGRQNP